MNSTASRICAWAGPAMIVTFCTTFIFIANLIPPIPPSWTAAQVQEFYQANSLNLRIGTALAMLGVAGGFAWSAGVAAWTARMEGPTLPVLSYSQLVCAGWSFGGAYLAIVFLSAAAFRERSPELIQVLNDLGWYWIVMPGSCAVMQCAFTGIAILSDKREDPFFPRWVGYFNIWMGILQAPGVMMAMFLTGPFAWNGLFTFWIPLTVFSFWIYVNTWAMLHATKREALRQEASADAR